MRVRGHTRQWAGLIALAAGAATIGMVPARADVINSPPKSCSFSEEIGEIELISDTPLTEGQSCDEITVPPPKVSAINSEWSPTELPVFIVMKRDRAVYTLYLASMLSDRRGRHLCWSQQIVGKGGRLAPSQLWSRVVSAFDQWAASCSTTRVVGAAAVRSAFLARESDFEQAFGRMNAVRTSRFQKPEEGIGIGSFLPTKISQDLLNAVTDACDGPRSRLQLGPDGVIEWKFDGSQPFGADLSRPFDSCVDEQIRYFPGYPVRN